MRDNPENAGKLYEKRRTDEEIVLGVMLIQKAGAGGAPPKNHQELAAFKQRLETLIVVTSQDDPDLEELARRCYARALCNKEPVAEVVQRLTAWRQHR